MLLFRDMKKLSFYKEKENYLVETPNPGNYGSCILAEPHNFLDCVSYVLKIAKQLRRNPEIIHMASDYVYVYRPSMSKKKAEKIEKDMIREQSEGIQLQMSGLSKHERRILEDIVREHNNLIKNQT